MDALHIPQWCEALILFLLVSFVEVLIMVLQVIVWSTYRHLKKRVYGHQMCPRGIGFEELPCIMYILRQFTRYLKWSYEVICKESYYKENITALHLNLYLLKYTVSMYDADSPAVTTLANVESTLAWVSHQLNHLTTKDSFSIENDQMYPTEPTISPDQSGQLVTLTRDVKTEGWKYSTSMFAHEQCKDKQR